MKRGRWLSGARSSRVIDQRVSLRSGATMNQTSRPTAASEGRVTDRVTIQVCLTRASMMASDSGVSMLPAASLS